MVQAAFFNAEIKQLNCGHMRLAGHSKVHKVIMIVSSILNLVSIRVRVESLKHGQILFS